VALKRKLHHWLVVLRRIKTWQLVLLGLAFAVAAAFALRQNNLEMIEKRNLLKKADEDNKDIKARLADLQLYVTTHMNTELGTGIFLEHSYQRANDEAVKKAVNSASPSGKLYTQAEAACRPEYDRSHVFRAYLLCIQDRLAELAPGQDPLAELKAPPPELFRYNFASPRWSVDLAGLLVFASLLSVVLIIFRLVGFIALKLILRHHR
jgi:hypothetical protein